MKFRTLVVPVLFPVVSLLVGCLRHGDEANPLSSGVGSRPVISAQIVQAVTSLPGRLQAEDYRGGGEGIGYHDLTTVNSGGQYRTDGVDIQATTDAGGGYNVGWIQAGEWLDYDV
ncbi:MAG: C-terminal target protein, partial [Fibrobacteres bacterium]|nr:C-terminal target protein [Fibrobacterota bacterium]